MIRISVVLTYFNGRKYIEEQIESLRQQSLPFDELLIFDDCSSNEQYSFLENYLRNIQDSISLHRNEKNYGYAKNFLNGCGYAQGEYVFLSDQDDIWDKDKIKLMMNVMEKYPELNLLACDIEPFYCYADSPKWDAKNLKTMKDDGSVEFVKADSETIHIMRSGSAMCFRKNFYEEIMPFWIEGWAHDDFLWKCALFTNSCALIHKSLIKRRIHDSNTSELKVRTREWRITELQEMKDQLEALEKYLSYKGITNQANEHLILNNKNGLKARIEFLKHRNPIKWVSLALKYRDTYPRIKGLFLDAYLSLFDTYKS